MPTPIFRLKSSRKYDVVNLDLVSALLILETGHSRNLIGLILSAVGISLKFYAASPIQLTYLIIRQHVFYQSTLVKASKAESWELRTSIFVGMIRSAILLSVSEDT